MLNNGHELFSHLKTSYVLPFTFVQRMSVMTDEQVKDVLGPIITAGQLKTPLLITFIILAFLFV